MFNRSVFVAALIFAATPAVRADFTVAADGSGQYRTVQEAIDASPSNGTSRFTIRIKPGTYKEKIVVPPSKRFLGLIGEDPKTTILTFGLYYSVPGEDGKPIGTFKTSSTTIQADDFTAENITFANSAGAVGQAVALAIFADRARFRNCRFLGWQDTLLAQTGRQLFENSYIEGATDFIFGGATAWFENTEIHIRGNGYITAASTPKDQEYGYIFSNCTITGEPGVLTYLGRPWRDYAATVFLRTKMDAVVRPTGWDNWQKPEREKTSRYAEFGSTGPGANDASRVTWAKLLSASDAARLTRNAVLAGKDGWNPDTLTARADAWTIPADARPRMETPGVANGQVVWFTADKKLAHGSKRIDVMAGKNAIDVRNPSLFFDAPRKQYVISWAATISDNYFQSYQEPVEDNPRLWYTTTTDFETFAPPQVLFEPGYTVRYGVILRDGNRYALLHEDSRRDIQKLRVSFSDSPVGPWGPSSDPLGEGFHDRVRIALAGDSTVAEGGGWGPGFRAVMSADVEVLNFARNGRSTKSFRDEGAWDGVLKAKADYVLIQFGHNDVPGKGADRETDAATTYRENLLRFANEVRAYGGMPVFVTSIVRRNLEADGTVKPDSLVPYVAAVRAIAAERHISVMDMYAATKAQCEGLGPAKCHELDAVATDGSPDTTHLNETGRKTIGAIAAKEFLKAVLGASAPAPSAVTANTLLPLNERRATFTMPERTQPKLPSIILVGDSTVRNGHGVGGGGQWGWGDLLNGSIDGQKMEVINRAVGGLSSRTFVRQGHWDRALALVRRGDTVVMQFGHNDESAINDYVRARGSIRGIGEETQQVDNLMTGEPEIVHTYGWYLGKMIREAKAKGARVIVCSPVPRNRWQDGKIIRTADFPGYAKDVAAREHVQFLDLNELVARAYETTGMNTVNTFFPADNTHTNREGAEIIAAVANRELTKLLGH